MNQAPPVNRSPFPGSSLCVVGNINRDIKTAPFQPGDYLWHDGETSLASFQETIGGGGANCASIAAKLGASVTFIGQVGDDALGRRLERTLTRHGVHCRLHRDAGTATGTTINLVFENGHRHFLSCHPNNAALSFENFKAGPLPRVDHLLRADVWFSEAMLFGGNEALFRTARQAGIPVSIDLNWDPQWNHANSGTIARRKEAVRQVLPLVELAHGNVRELCEFTDAAGLDAAVSRLLDWGVAGVVAHMGGQGAGWFSRAESVIEPPAPIANRVAATGSGDVLSTCFILLCRQKAGPGAKLKLANQIVGEFMEGKRAFLPTLED